MARATRASRSRATCAARDARFEVLARPHQGLVAALNAGLERCRGRLIARMDADDVMHRERLAAQAAALDASPRARRRRLSHTAVSERGARARHARLRALARLDRFRRARARGSLRRVPRRASDADAASRGAARARLPRARLAGGLRSGAARCSSAARRSASSPGACSPGGTLPGASRRPTRPTRRPASRRARPISSRADFSPAASGTRSGATAEPGARSRARCSRTASGPA